MPDAPLSDRETELFSAAAALLRRASDELRTRIAPDRDSPEVRRFAAAMTAVEPRAESPERVVHIEELFYRDPPPFFVTTITSQNHFHPLACEFRYITSGYR